MGNNAQANVNQPDPLARQFYLDCLRVLDRADLPYLIGGGYALAFYTGIARQTKDLDIFVRPGDAHRALDALGGAGYRTETTWPHFLVKAVTDYAFMDILFNSGNGLCPVDDAWFAAAREGQVLGRDVRLCPPEEMIWSKAFVQERDRYDGADVNHLILAQGQGFDWSRLIGRFASHERVLLAHLILFGYVYPSHREKVPGWVLDELEARVRAEAATVEPICNGTFLAHNQYAPDVQKWGFIDARLTPAGPLRAEDAATLAPA